MSTKKKIASAIGVIAFAAMASWNVYQSQQEVALSDLMLENIESLARDEIENYYNMHLEIYSSNCKICKDSGTWCNVHDQMPC